MGVLLTVIWLYELMRAYEASQRPYVSNKRKYLVSRLENFARQNA